ncbi:arsenical pump-driving ATPase [Jeotgalibacillus salarius]|uniref:Arsenical pump-driving ATPase n=1 Tax=Jeotgalibacillus salarius TaxID=546023 RepID=A0A4Y8LAS4_9BACL|nr:arsenical pump-driving ATPase [Jeotgalibacillus salarius]TFD99731.1 arsenical pump-driving ATPase [Jeotgalibacillus salarius]
MYSRFDPLEQAFSRYLFFTGKGGVGKTSTASATAIALAEAGKKVLIVSTDPASNLQDVLEQEIPSEPVAVKVANLFACNINPEEAARQYRERVIGPYRGVLPDDAVASMEEQLSGACTVEMAAFDEFTSLLVNDEYSSFDHIVFDTAPTGHTLRLLALPAAWSGFLETSTHGVSCLGPLSGLSEKKQSYEKSLSVLSDVSQTSLFLVTRPDSSAIKEAMRASEELKATGMDHQHLIINGFADFNTNDSVAQQFQERQQDALKNLSFPVEKTFMLPYTSRSLTGFSSLSSWIKSLPETETFTASAESDTHSLDQYVQHLVKGNKKLVMTMGKGGVGKTTVAASVALKLAEKGFTVHLTTTDPADHLTNLFKDHKLESLTVSNINPKEVTAAYTEKVLSDAGELSAEEREYLEEDLRSPCTEEIAVFRAFADTVADEQYDFIVMDTAPTGHTLLLLDAAESYHKEVERTSADVPNVKKLLPALRNPDHTSIAIVTLAEATPVLEAARLSEDLQRADIQPDWWIVNQSLLASGTNEPILKNRSAVEAKWINKVCAMSADTALLPWTANPLSEQLPV